MTDQGSKAVIAWWIGMSAISVVNVAIWLLESGKFGRGEASPGQPRPFPRRRQALLSAIFVLGCAFRSLLPRAEPLRTCLYDSWLSSATLGRLVATVAELCFVAQWALLLGEWAKHSKSPFGTTVARVLLPLIAIAELCSWYATLTTNWLGSVIEESLWAICGALVAAMLAALWLRARGLRRRFLQAALVLDAVYVLFMFAVDVPMYFSRWRTDERQGRPYLSLRQGWHDAAHRRIVTRRWEDWREEVPWMSLYFSAGVWFSISLIRAPRLEDRRWS